MRLIHNGNIICIDTTADDINSLFERINNIAFEIIILEDDRTDSYVQSICNKYEGLIEARIYNNDGYCQWRQECLTGDESFDEYKQNLNTSLFTMQVPRKQIANIATVKKIIKHFLITRNIDESYNWVKILF